MCLSKHLLEYGYLSAYLPAYICVFVCVFVCLIIYEFSFCENVNAAVIIVLFTNQRRHTSTTMPESALILTNAGATHLTKLCVLQIKILEKKLSKIRQ